MNNLKYGVIGGAHGIGSWFVKYFESKNLETSYSDLNQSKSNSTYYKDNLELVRNSDVIVLAVPIECMAQVFEEIVTELGGKKLIEVCSVKGFMIRKYEELKGNFEFHSLHPMFGSDLESLEGQGIIQIDYDNYEQGEFMQSFLNLLKEDKANIFTINHKRHDRIMATIQGLNHFNLFVSAKTVYNMDFDINKYKELSSPTYRIFFIIFTRYMFHNPTLYMEIQMHNEEVLEVLDRFREEVDIMYDFIKNKDRVGYLKYMEEMQPYFRDNKEDYELSKALIDTLGHLLKN